MGWNDRMDEWSVTNLPDEAVDSSSRLIDIDEAWLQKASPSIKRQAMKAWFLARYCDPAEETPYISAEGGYIFVNGGPYHPQDELDQRFRGIVEEELISDVVEELQSNVGDDWAPIQWGDYDDYDEEFGVSVANPKDPANVLERRLQEISEVLTLTGSVAAIALAKKLAYSNVITAFESYLWETMTYAVENDDRVLKNIVTRFPHFKDQGMKLGQIYDKFDSLRGLVKGYLQDTVWHKWDSVTMLIAHALEIKAPSFDAFVDPTIKRHDIIHRSGNTKDGEPIDLGELEIPQLMDAVRNFAMELEGHLLERYTQQIHAEIAAEFEKLDDMLEDKGV